MEAVVLSFYLNSLICTICLVLFEILRRSLPTIYNGSNYHKERETQEPRLDTNWNCHGIIGWWLDVYKVPWHRVLQVSDTTIQC